MLPNTTARGSPVNNVTSEAPRHVDTVYREVEVRFHMVIGGHLHAMTILPPRISTGNHCIGCHVTSRAVDRTPILRSSNLQIMQQSYVLHAGFTVSVCIQ
jgi:hypothetical protein